MNQKLPSRPIAALHCIDRTYIQRPIRIIHPAANNFAFIHKNASNWHFVGGKSLFSLSRSAQYLRFLYIIDPIYHVKGSSHISLMLLVKQKALRSLRFNLDITKLHNDQSHVSYI